MSQNRYDHPTRKVFDKTVDQLKRRIKDKGDQVRLLTRRVNIIEKVLKELYIASGCPNLESDVGFLILEGSGKIVNKK